MLRISTRVLRASATRPVFSETVEAPKQSKKTYVQKEGYITLDFATPNEIIYKQTPVKMFMVNTTKGVVGVLSKHASLLAELNPGLVSVCADDQNTITAEYFVPGGFVTINEPENYASIVAGEAIPLEEFDYNLVKKNLDEANSDLAKFKEGPEWTDAMIRVTTYAPLAAALEAAKK